MQPHASSQQSYGMSSYNNSNAGQPYNFQSYQSVVSSVTGPTTTAMPPTTTMPPKKVTLKVVILGDSGVGKTSLLNRYATGKFTGQYKATIGADVMTKTVLVQDSTTGQNTAVQLQLWDTAGQERFQSLGVAFYRGADAAMLVYDITDPHSLDHLQHWQTEFYSQLNIQLAGLQSVPFPFCVVANKQDKQNDRLVPANVGQEWCRQHAPPGSPALYFCEASAKTAWQVDEAFCELARLALNYTYYKKQSQPQLFVPPVTPPIDLRPASNGAAAEPKCC